MDGYETGWESRAIADSRAHGECGAYCRGTALKGKWIHMPNIDELFKRRHCDREIIFLFVVWVGA
jgi:hypothetical protein